MRSEDERIDLEQVRVRSAEAGIAALKDDCQELHAKAARMGDSEAAVGMRREADDRDESAEDLRGAMHRGRGKNPMSWTNHGAHTDQRGASGNSAASAHISDRGSMTVAIIALMVACIALGAVIMLPAQQAAHVEVLGEQVNKAERESRVMQERWNDLKVELAKRQIPVSDH